MDSSYVTASENATFGGSGLDLPTYQPKFGLQDF